MTTKYQSYDVSCSKKKKQFQKADFFICDDSWISQEKINKRTANITETTEINLNTVTEYVN